MKSLIKNIVEFIEVLRLSGVRVSLAETMDAVSSLEHVDLLKKEQVYSALSACLAKSEEEQRIFSEAFDRFFIPVFQRNEWVKEKTIELQEKRAEVVKNSEDLKFQGQELDLSNTLKEVYTGLSNEEKQSIKDFLGKTSTGKNVNQNFKPIIERLMRSKLEKLKQERTGDFNEYSGVLGSTLSEAGMIAGEISDSVRKETHLLNKNLGDISDEDVPSVIHLIRKITNKIRRENIRKNKNSGKRIRLDIKKTIRSSLNTGGVMVRLKYKRRPARKERYLVLCDVSASMYRFSGFVLQFILNMQAGAMQTDSCIFAEDFERLNLQDGLSLSNFDKRIKESSVWGKGTNIGNALKQLLDSREMILKSSTVAIIVSDAKTLEFDKAVQALSKVKSKVKRIIWLNPIPQSEWERILGIDSLKTHCTMLDCSTLKRLEAASKSF